MKFSIYLNRRVYVMKTLVLMICHYKYMPHLWIRIWLGHSVSQSHFLLSLNLDVQTPLHMTTYKRHGRSKHIFAGARKMGQGLAIILLLKCFKIHVFSV